MLREYAIKKSNNRPSWLVSKSYLIPVVFIITFGSVGVLFGSYAETPCTKQNISIDQDNDCVMYMKRILNATDNHWNGSYLNPNGDFGTLTLEQVKKFQATPTDNLNQFTGGVATGVVGENTWQELCYADNIWHGLEEPFNDAGCQLAFGVKWGGMYPDPPRV
jgi:peptidoglycan hydrolase-like protein with peptidoglycan-binding domain